MDILRPDTNAGDRASFAYLKTLVKNGYTVKFLPTYIRTDIKETYYDLLKDLGVEILTDYNNCINKQYVKNWLRVNGSLIDYVFLNRPGVYEYYNDLLKKYIPNAKFIYQGHDIHYLRLNRACNVGANTNLLKQVDKYKKLENKIWNDYDYILYFSDKETEIVKEQVANANTVAVPLFLYSEFDKIEYIPQNRQDLLFVGGFGHTPNKDAMIWFLQEIFPLILAKNSKIKLNIVGSDCPQEIRDIAKNNDNVTIHGYLSDKALDKLYEHTRIVISPLRYGAGVKGKIIEAMKKQIPVVTTSIGAEGINSDLLTVADNAIDFAKELLSLYDDNVKLTQISNDSFDFIKNNFSENFVTKLMKYVDNNNQCEISVK